MLLEDGEGGSPSPSVVSICSSPIKDYCRNGNSDSISKDPPENVAVLSNDTPDSQPIEKKQRSLKTVLILEIK